VTGQVESGNAALAYTLTGLQRRTLGTMLGHALDHHAWDDADLIVRALDDYWDTRGLGGEATAWAERILAATTGSGQTPDAPAEELWLYTLSRQANRQMNAGQQARAGQTYRRMLTWLQEQPATEWTRESTAVTYHQLGITAHDRGRLDEAVGWYRKSLAIVEELGNRPGMALTYAQSGLLAEERGQAAQALAWNIRCVTLFSDFPAR
jgi:tetratricopeptide (TPR) repeat protein